MILNKKILSKNYHISNSFYFQIKMEIDEYVIKMKEFHKKNSRFS